jgi:hypothetical protein
MAVKNVEFYADSKFVNMSSINCPKKVIGKKQKKKVQNPKNSKFTHFFAHNFENIL